MVLKETDLTVSYYCPCNVPTSADGYIPTGEQLFTGRGGSFSEDRPEGGAPARSVGAGNGMARLVSEEEASTATALHCP